MNKQPMIKEYIKLPTEDPFFISLCSWALGRDDLRKQFKDETDIDMESCIGRSGIEKMIDESTGREKEAMQKWADWVYKELW